VIVFFIGASKPVMPTRDRTRNVILVSGAAYGVWVNGMYSSGAKGACTSTYTEFATTPTTV
jgi:hypothetical protein